MAGLSCCDVWHFSEVRARARLLDEFYPECQCEPYPLQAFGGDAVSSNDLLARIITSPAHYDLTGSELLTAKLTSLYAVGLSVIRSGATDDEILETIDMMLGGQAEGQSLVGAVIIDAKSIRDMVSDTGDRCFGVYATDAGAKTHHADITGAFPRTGSNSAKKNEQSARRYKLRDVMADRIVRAETPDELLSALRASGI